VSTNERNRASSYVLRIASAQSRISLAVRTPSEECEPASVATAVGADLVSALFDDIS
jgi:hypothetical protein